MACISKYIYSNCSTLAVGCTLYSDNTLQTKLGAGYHKIPVGTGYKNFTTNSNGVITAETVCSWNSNIEPYAPLYTSTKNNCVGGTNCTAVGSTVTLNDGSPANVYSVNIGYTSYISQADANAQAQALSEASFNANKQAEVNSRGYCTYTYSAGSGYYSADFTKNNCGTDCYANGVVSFSKTMTGYSAVSTASCSDAATLANAAAYTAARNFVNANGQANANTYGYCCCWVADPACYNCYRYADRQRNTCTGAYRNDYVTASNSCDCGQGCAGTNYDYYECVNTFGQDKLYKERYNCAPYNFTGATNLVTCGCTSNSPDIRYLDPLEQTCIDCQLWYILRDFAVCSPTAGHYFAKGIDYGFTKPSTAPCPNDFNGSYIGVRCMDLGLTGETTYDVYQNTNACGYRYRADGGGNSVYINSLTGYAGVCGLGYG